MRVSVSNFFSMAFGIWRLGGECFDMCVGVSVCVCLCVPKTWPS